MPDSIAIAKPGIHDIPAKVYHADPVPGGSLSASGAQLILPVLKGCPARFRWAMDNPQPPSDVFDFGHVAHRLVLGKGEEFEVIKADDWRKKAVQEARDTAREAGKIPILEKDFDRAARMASALSLHWAASAFVEGKPEQSLFWRDRETGVMCRARLDWLPNHGAIFTDYKTCASAHPDDIARAMDNHGYWLQAAWYCQGIRALGIHEDPQFVFVFQEKEPPYLVTVAQPDLAAVAWGEMAANKARSIYAECKASGRWPGYAEDVLSVALPAYTERRLEIANDMGAFQVAQRFQAPISNAAE